MVNHAAFHHRGREFAERNGSGRQDGASRIHDNEYLRRFRDLFETLLLCLDFVVGPGVIRRIAAGIHQINRNIVVVWRDLACGLRIFDRIGFQCARKGYLEVSFRSRDLNARIGVLVTSRQQCQSGQDAKTFRQFFHRSFNKNRRRGLPLPRGNSIKFKFQE